MSDSYLPITLPSRCIPYEGVDPDSIKIRSYTGEDEVFLSEINILNQTSKFLSVLERVIQGVDPIVLTAGDKLYIMIWEYINSYSETIYEKDVCTSCMQEVSFVVDLREMDVIKLPEDLVVPVQVSIDDGDPILLRLLNIEDELKIQEYSAKHADGHLYKLARLIVDPNKDLLERKAFLSSAPAKVLAKIRGRLAELYHGPSLSAKVTCPSCGREDLIEVPFRFEFLFPTGETLTDAFGTGV